MDHIPQWSRLRVLKRLCLDRATAQARPRESGRVIFIRLLCDRLLCISRRVHKARWAEVAKMPRFLAVSHPPAIGVTQIGA